MMILSGKMRLMKITSLHVLNLQTWTWTRTTTGTSHHGGQHAGAGMLPHSLLGQIKVLEQQLVNLQTKMILMMLMLMKRYHLRWESLLQNRQKTVRLTTNCHSQSQMFNTICYVTYTNYEVLLKNFLQIQM